MAQNFFGVNGHRAAVLNQKWKAGVAEEENGGLHVNLHWRVKTSVLLLVTTPVVSGTLPTGFMANITEIGCWCALVGNTFGRAHSGTEL